MNTTNIWRTEDGTHFYGPFARTGEIDVQAAVAVVGKTWSPTRTAAGFTAQVRGQVIGRHFATVTAAKTAIATAL